MNIVRVSGRAGESVVIFGRPEKVLERAKLSRHSPSIVPRTLLCCVISNGLDNGVYPLFLTRQQRPKGHESKAIKARREREGKARVRRARYPTFTGEEKENRGLVEKDTFPLIADPFSPHSRVHS